MNIPMNRLLPLFTTLAQHTDNVALINLTDDHDVFVGVAGDPTTFTQEALEELEAVATKAGVDFDPEYVDPWENEPYPCFIISLR